MLYQLPQETIITDTDLGLLIFIRDDTIDKYSIHKIYKNPHNPHVAVRVAVLADLLEVYGYSLNRIVIDVPVDRHVSKQLVDIVVYSDDGQQKPCIVICCSGVNFGKHYHKELIHVIADAKRMGARYAVHESLKKRTVIAIERLDKDQTKETLIADIPSYMGE